MQALLLWKMIFMKYEPSFTDMKPKLEKSLREELKAAGLIDYEKRLKKGKKKNVAVQHVVLTDTAWDWAVQNLDAEISQSTFAGPVLQSVLSHLKKFIQNKNSSLFEFLHSDSATMERNEEVPALQPVLPLINPADLESRIRSAYFQFTGQQTHVRMRLAKLREVLAEIPRDLLDQSLRELKRAEKIFLFPFEDPQEKEPPDDEAALLEAGRINHVILIEG
jgi:hypothetical protein